MSASLSPTPVKVALRPEHAAEALDVSTDFFRERVAPEIRVVRRGALKLYSVRELERWLLENGEPAP